jgi:hypothetical protein
MRWWICILPVILVLGCVAAPVEIHQSIGGGVEKNKLMLVGDMGEDVVDFFGASLSDGGCEWFAQSLDYGEESRVALISDDCLFGGDEFTSIIPLGDGRFRYEINTSVFSIEPYSLVSTYEHHVFTDKTVLRTNGLIINSSHVIFLGSSEDILYVEYGSFCGRDSDCMDYEVCINASCVDFEYGCLSNNGDCYPFECFFDFECDQGHWCFENKCVSADCSCGILEGGVCEKFECCSDLDCSLGLVCVDNICHIPECVEDNDCLLNESCLSSSCTAVLCRDWEEVINHSCRKISCTFPLEPKNHGCGFGFFSLMILGLMLLVFLSVFFYAYLRMRSGVPPL